MTTVVTISNRFLFETTHHKQVFCSEEGEQPFTEHDNTDTNIADDNSCQEHPSAPPAPVTGASSQQRRLVQYEKRLELAELSIAIAESVKLWVSVVPWRVQVLFRGQLILSTLRAEEETLPWPPDPGPLPGTDGDKMGGSVDSEGDQEPVARPQQQSCMPCNGETEGIVLETGCVS